MRYYENFFRQKYYKNSITFFNKQTGEEMRRKQAYLRKQTDLGYFSKVSLLTMTLCIML